MTVTFFDNAEEMFAMLRKHREVADASIMAWQKKLEPGDFVIRIAGAYGGVVIYGELIDPVESDRPYYDFDDPESRAEFEYIRARYADPSWTSSYRFGKFYSPFCPDGELGDIHLATVTMKIDRDHFEAARSADWPQITSK